MLNCCEILACPNCKTPVTLVKNGTRPQVRPVPSRVPDQGRHPGDADRRGHDRALSEDPARPAAPHRRRRLHDAGHSRASPALPARAPQLRGRAGRGAHRHRQPPSRRGHRRAQAARPGAAARRRRAWRGGCGARATTSPSTCTAARAARWLTWASGAPRAHRLRHQGPRLDVHQPAWRARPTCAPRHSVREPVGPAGAARHRRRPTRRPTPWRWATIPRRPPAPTAACARPASTPRTPLVVIHVSAGNPFRRWPAGVVPGPDGGAGAARPGSSYPADVRAVRRRRPRARSPSRRAQALGELAAAVPDLGEFDLHELRALIARAAGLHRRRQRPAARGRHDHACRSWRCSGPTLPERSKPWRDPRWFVETIDHALPCRPCHQRVCEPGDFRCLTWTSAEQVTRGRRARHRRRAPTRGERRAMTTATATLARAAGAADPRPRRARGCCWLFVASLQMSIFAAQILLTLTLVCWVALLVRDRARPSAPAFFMPLVVYGVADAALVGVLARRRRRASPTASSWCCFAVVPAVFDLARGRRASTVIDVIVTVGAASAACGIDPVRRCCTSTTWASGRRAISHHYMTYSGVLMLVVCAALARLVFGVARPHLAGAGDAGDRRRPVPDAGARRLGGHVRGRRRCCSACKDFRLIGVASRRGGARCSRWRPTR